MRIPMEARRAECLSCVWEAETSSLFVEHPRELNFAGIMHRAPLKVFEIVSMIDLQAATRMGQYGFWKVVRGQLLLAALPTLAIAQEPPPQPPPAPQNPSPMVELSRAHERIEERPLAGAARSFEGPLAKPVSVFVPESARKAKTLNLVIHFHGSSFLPQYAVARLRDYAVAVVQLGSGSGIYDRSFSDRTFFDSLLIDVQRSAEEAVGHSVQIRSVILSGFSAGHGAIRAILRDSAHFVRIDGLLLLDGLHTSYDPDRKVVADGGRLDPANLTEFVRFARAAIRGDKRFLITHSEIFPGTFASTTETTNYLLETLGLKRKPTLRWGPLGMQQTSEAHSGRFAVLGFAGNSGPDHIDHFHGMYHFLAALERMR